MNKYNAAAFLPIVQALVNGKTIEYHTELDGGKWTEVTEVEFTSKPEQYRIKPDPRKIWVNIYPDGALQAYPTKEKAQQYCGRAVVRIAVPFVEVL
jgi:hypothetical protein